MYRIIIITFALFLSGFMARAQADKVKASEYYTKAQKLQTEKKFSDAIGYYQKALAANPDYAAASYGAGWCYNELGKYNDALLYLEKAKKEMSNDAKLFFEMGYACQKLGKTEDARANYDKCLSLNKEYHLVHRQLGDICLDLDDFKCALDHYNTYLQKKDDISSPGFFYNKGYAECELGKYNEAIISLNKAIELKSDNPSYFDELGFAYYKLKNADSATKQYTRANILNPKLHTPYLGFGDINKTLLKNTDEALKNYLKAVELKPDNKKGLYSVGWCYNDKGNYNEAIRYLKRAIEVDKNYVSAYTEIGYSYYSLGEYNNAIAVFEKAISIDDRNILSYYYSGLCQVNMKNKSEALKVLRKLEEISPTYAEKLKAKIDAM